MRKNNAVCTKCGTGFYARPSQVKKGFGKYCSIQCHALDKTFDVNVYPLTRQCLQCNTNIVIESSRYKGRKFCSQPCAAKYNNEKRTGMEYKQSSSFRDALIDKHGHKCMVCGYATFVDAHHIVPRSKGGANGVDNGILLCPNHHREADRGLITPEQLRKFLRA